MKYSAPLLTGLAMAQIVSVEEYGSEMVESYASTAIEITSTAFEAQPSETVVKDLFEVVDESSEVYAEEEDSYDEYDSYGGEEAVAEEYEAETTEDELLDESAELFIDDSIEEDAAEEIEDEESNEDGYETMIGEKVDNMNDSQADFEEEFSEEDFEEEFSSDLEEDFEEEFSYSLTDIETSEPYETFGPILSGATSFSFAALGVFALLL